MSNLDYLPLDYNAFTMRVPSGTAIGTIGYSPVYKVPENKRAILKLLSVDLTGAGLSGFYTWSLLLRENPGSPEKVLFSARRNYTDRTTLVYAPEIRLSQYNEVRASYLNNTNSPAGLQNCYIFFEEYGVYTTQGI